MIYGEARKVVTFNLNRPEEREMYELANSIKFAPLVKRYLLQELRRRNEPPTTRPSSIQVRTD